MVGNVGLGQNSPVVANEAAPGTYLSDQKDTKESSTQAQFGEVWKKIQSQYGLKPEKAREIKKTLGKDDFLRIMITQMQNQDPTSPFKAEQVAAQMAQFASVEQLQNLNQSMGKMATQNNPVERLTMTNLIGKTVTVDKERFPHNEGFVSELTFELSRDAADVKVNVANELGEVIAEQSLGPQKAGLRAFSWDGTKRNSLPAKTGSYIFKVEAVDGQGSAIPMNTQSQARVVGVSFEGAEPVFLVGDIRSPSRILLRNIVRIDEQAGVGSEVQSSPRQTLSKPSTKNYFGFQRGVGSIPIDQSMLPTEAKASMEPSEKGFPNGLSGDDSSPVNNIQRNVEIEKGGEIK